jgi:hypothetical protein
MEYRWKVFAALLFAILSVTIGLSLIAFRVSQAIWNFDIDIIGVFLVGDIGLHLFIKLRKSEKFQKIVHLFQSTPPPSWSRLALASVWFLIIILLVGEGAKFLGLLETIGTTGKLPTWVIVEWSAFFSFWLSLDFITYHRQEFGIEEDYRSKQAPNEAQTPTSSRGKTISTVEELKPPSPPSGLTPYKPDWWRNHWMLLSVGLAALLVFVGIVDSTLGKQQEYGTALWAVGIAFLGITMFLYDAAQTEQRQYGRLVELNSNLEQKLKDATMDINANMDAKVEAAAKSLSGQIQELQAELKKLKESLYGTTST